MLCLDSSANYMTLPDWYMFCNQRCKAADSMELAILVTNNCWSLDFPYINNHFILIVPTDSYLFVVQRCTVNSKTQKFVSQNKKKAQESIKFRTMLSIFLIFLSCFCQYAQHICVKVLFLFPSKCSCTAHFPLSYKSLFVMS